MNLDERIEALTMSLELLTHDHEDFKRRTEKMLTGMHELLTGMHEIVRSMQGMLLGTREVVMSFRDEQQMIAQAIVKLTQLEGRINGLEQQ